MKPKIAIVGGGPAGLSMAHMLDTRGTAAPTVFEALERVGGKSWTIYRGDAVVEMGTCYTTRSHRTVTSWMKSLGMTQRLLGEQLFDGDDVIRYIRKGAGPALPVQVIAYWRERSRLMEALTRRRPTREDLSEAAQPVSEWLRARNLHKMERLMQRAMTGLGYGFLERTPTLHALRWVDMELILTGLVKQLKMPVEGWSQLWDRIARDLDVRTATPVSAIARHAKGVDITTARGTERFDGVVCAIPLDEFAALLDSVTDHEDAVMAGVRWQRYATSLVAVKDWFTAHPVEAYSTPIVNPDEIGRLVSARREGEEPELGGWLYVTGQYAGDYTPIELREILLADIERRGGRPVGVIEQRVWKYMPTYSPQAIHDGLPQRLEAMQGDRRTLYTGAIWSHESVSHIVNYNTALLHRMTGTLSGWQRADDRTEAHAPAL